MWCAAIPAPLRRYGMAWLLLIVAGLVGLKLAA